jgi:hypothetical protein
VLVSKSEPETQLHWHLLLSELMPKQGVEEGVGTVVGGGKGHCQSKPMTVLVNERTRTHTQSGAGGVRSSQLL